MNRQDAEPSAHGLGGDAGAGTARQRPAGPSTPGPAPTPRGKRKMARGPATPGTPAAPQGSAARDAGRVAQPYLATAPAPLTASPGPETHNGLLLPSDHMRTVATSRYYASGLVSPPAIIGSTGDRERDRERERERVGTGGNTPGPLPHPTPQRAYAAGLVAPPFVVPRGRSSSPLPQAPALMPLPRRPPLPHTGSSRAAANRSGERAGRTAEVPDGQPPPRRRNGRRVVNNVGVSRRPAVSTREEHLSRRASMRRVNVWDDLPDAAEPPPPFPFPTPSNARLPPTFSPVDTHPAHRPGHDSFHSTHTVEPRPLSPPPTFDEATRPRSPTPETDDDDSLNGTEEQREDRRLWEADIAHGYSLEERVAREARRREARAEAEARNIEPDDPNATPQADGNVAAQADEDATSQADGNVRPQADENATSQADENATSQANENATPQADAAETGSQREVVEAAVREADDAKNSTDEDLEEVVCATLLALAGKPATKAEIIEAAHVALMAKVSERRKDGPPATEPAEVTPKKDGQNIPLRNEEPGVLSRLNKAGERDSASRASGNAESDEHARAASPTSSGTDANSSAREEEAMPCVPADSPQPPERPTSDVVADDIDSLPHMSSHNASAGPSPKLAASQTLRRMSSVGSATMEIRSREVTPEPQFHDARTDTTSPAPQPSPTTCDSPTKHSAHSAHSAENLRRTGSSSTRPESVVRAESSPTHVSERPQSSMVASEQEEPPNPEQRQSPSHTRARPLPSIDREPKVTPPPLFQRPPMEYINQYNPTESYPPPIIDYPVPPNARLGSVRPRTVKYGEMALSTPTTGASVSPRPPFRRPALPLVPPSASINPAPLSTAPSTSVPPSQRPGPESQSALGATSQRGSSTASIPADPLAYSRPIPPARSGANTVSPGSLVSPGTQAPRGASVRNSMLSAAAAFGSAQRPGASSADVTRVVKRVSPTGATPTGRADMPPPPPPPRATPTYTPAGGSGRHYRPGTVADAVEHFERSLAPSPVSGAPASARSPSPLTAAGRASPQPRPLPPTGPFGERLRPALVQRTNTSPSVPTRAGATRPVMALSQHRHSVAGGMAFGERTTSPRFGLVDEAQAQAYAPPRVSTRAEIEDEAQLHEKPSPVSPVTTGSRRPSLPQTPVMLQAQSQSLSRTQQHQRTPPIPSQTPSAHYETLPAHHQISPAHTQQLPEHYQTPLTSSHHRMSLSGSDADAQTPNRQLPLPPGDPAAEYAYHQSRALPHRPSQGRVLPTPPTHISPHYAPPITPPQHRSHTRPLPVPKPTVEKPGERVERMPEDYVMAKQIVDRRLEVEEVPLVVQTTTMHETGAGSRRVVGKHDSVASSVDKEDRVRQNGTEDHNSRDEITTDKPKDREVDHGAKGRTVNLTNDKGLSADVALSSAQAHAPLPPLFTHNYDSHLPTSSSSWSLGSNEGQKATASVEEPEATGDDSEPATLYPAREAALKRRDLLSDTKPVTSPVAAGKRPAPPPPPPRPTSVPAVQALRREHDPPSTSSPDLEALVANSPELLQLLESGDNGTELLVPAAAESSAQGAAKAAAAQAFAFELEQQREIEAQIHAEFARAERRMSHRPEPRPEPLGEADDKDEPRDEAHSSSPPLVLHKSPNSLADAPHDTLPYKALPVSQSGYSEEMFRTMLPPEDDDSHDHDLIDFGEPTNAGAPLAGRHEEAWKAHVKSQSHHNLFSTGPFNTAPLRPHSHLGTDTHLVTQLPAASHTPQRSTPAASSDSPLRAPPVPPPPRRIPPPPPPPLHKTSPTRPPPPPPPSKPPPRSRPPPVPTKDNDEHRFSSTDLVFGNPRDSVDSSGVTSPTIISRLPIPSSGLSSGLSPQQFTSPLGTNSSKDAPGGTSFAPINRSLPSPLSAQYSPVLSNGPRNASGIPVPTLVIPKRGQSLNETSEAPLPPLPIPSDAYSMSASGSGSSPLLPPAPPALRAAQSYSSSTSSLVDTEAMSGSETTPPEQRGGIAIPNSTNSPSQVVTPRRANRAPVYVSPPSRPWATAVVAPQTPRRSGAYPTDTPRASGQLPQQQQQPSPVASVHNASASPPVAVAPPLSPEITDVDLFVSRLEGTGHEFEGLTHLTQFLGPAQEAGASDAALATLVPAPVEVESRRVNVKGKVKLKMSVLGVRVANCPICLAQFRGDDAAVLLPRCGHVSHETCARRWFRESNACMVCRTPLVEDDSLLQ